MSLSVLFGVFPVIFLGELPDKTMFASLVLSTKGRPLTVWAGAAAAFTVHVLIAVSIGVALFTLLPHRAVESRRRDLPRGCRACDWRGTQRAPAR